MRLVLGTTPRRFAAISLLVVLVVGCAAALGLPWWSVYEASSGEVAELGHRLAKVRALVARADDAAKAAAGLEDELVRDRRVLRATSQAQAQGGLSSLVSTALQRAGGRPRSSQLLPTTESDGLLTLGVRLDADLTIRTLVRWLRALERQPAVLRVSKMSITAAPARMASGPDGRALRVTLEIQALGILEQQTVEQG